MSAVSLLAILLPAQFWKRYFKISLYYYIIIYVFLSFYVFISLIQLLSSLVYTHFCLLLPHHELYPFYYYISSSWLANLKLNFTISHQYCLSFLFSHLRKISLPPLNFLLHFQCVFYRHTALFILLWWSLSMREFSISRHTWLYSSYFTVYSSLHCFLFLFLPVWSSYLIIISLLSLRLVILLYCSVQLMVPFPSSVN